MSLDPLGYYARLGVAPDCTPAELKAAFRRQAARLHPDAAGTGDAASFLRLKEAYDVLRSPERRARYRREAAYPNSSADTHLYRTRHPTPITVVRYGPWLAGAGCAVLAVIVGLIVAFPGSSDDRPSAPSSIAAPIPRGPAEGGEPAVALAGTPDHYLLPGPELAVVWHVAPDGAISRLGTLADFTAVHAAETAPAFDGLAAITLAGGALGYVDSERLIPGDPAAAKGARCAYFAGPPPANGEVLARGAGGNGDVTVSNASDGPAVVTLVDSAKQPAARVFLTPGGSARLAGLPGNSWTAEVAFGELWSRQCKEFVAGARSLHPPDPIRSGATVTIGAQGK